MVHHLALRCTVKRRHCHDDIVAAAATGNDGQQWERVKPAIPTCMLPQSCSNLTVHIVWYILLYSKKVSIEYVYKTGQEVMGRTSMGLGKLLPGSPEDIRFCGLFGVSAKLAKTTWELMEEHGLHPPGSDFLHFLWALAFMQTYPPNNNLLSRVLGGHDLKTISKNIWPVIRSIYALNDVVVVVIAV
jgi:hypothetical protein